MSRTDTGDQRFDYVYHLQLDQLLTSMRQVTTHPEEHLFVTVHHVLELWFKHILFDLERVIALLQANDLPQANWLLRRIGEILKLAEAHWTVLETMSAADFAEFRGNLTGASGMQSRQFRQVEVMIGLHQTADNVYRERTERLWPGLMAEHPVTLRDAFFGVYDRAGVSLLDVYRDRWNRHDLFQLAENAFEIDRRFQSWRHNHILMVRRQIGIRARGTGGTFFRDYLASTTAYCFFPELFEFRNDLTEASGGEVMEKDTE
ncbi:MAG: tryptophan 2,3-dioxygenase family protein [Paracoccaceae bacterium]